MLDAGTVLGCYFREVDLRFNTVNTGEQTHPIQLFSTLRIHAARERILHSGQRIVPFGTADSALFALRETCGFSVSRSAVV